ncbi:hypothetical protein LTS17_003402 [Exophiala oligosperma]
MASDRSRQFIRDDSVYISSSASSGRSVHAAKHVEAKSQIMYVAQPLMVALETAKLPTNCYFCLKSPQELLPDVNGQVPTLKKCTGCQVARFCNKRCQKSAWAQYHRLECKVYGRLFPNILPSNVRAIIRLLMQNEAGLLPVGELDELLSLESHWDKLQGAGGERWENLLLITQAIKSYSGSDLAVQRILRVLCILTINTFTLTNPFFESLGLALHPRTSMFNHSCAPNAYVRFDVSQSESSGASNYQSISVHALRPLDKDEEITLSYVDGKNSFEARQQELKERYFFTCACTRCMSEQNATVLPPETTENAKTMENHVTQLMSKIQQLPVVDSELLHEIRTAMAAFAELGCWPLYHYPWFQLRHGLTEGLINSGKWSEALLQSAIITRYIHPVLYEQGHHPIRLTEMWTLWNVCCSCLESGYEPVDQARDNKSFQMLNILRCVVLDDLNKALTNGIRVNGAIEHIVDVSQRRASIEDRTWGEYRRNKTLARKTVWAWLESQIKAQLKNEGVPRTLIEVSMAQNPPC